MRPPRPSRPLLLALLLCVALPPAPCRANEVAGGELAAVLPEGENLTGKQIYERFLRNRYRESLQKIRIVSADDGGSEQANALTLSVKDYRDAEGNPHNGISFKMLVEIDSPFDMRHTTYLMIARRPGPNDEFVYRPSARTVRRVDLQRTSLLGTDFSFRDIGFQSVEDAEYIRHPDEVVDGRPVHVVEARIRPEVESPEYHKTILYLDQEHYVPLRGRYWNEFDIEIKELRAPAKSLRAFGGAWVATETTMSDLRQQTSSTLYVDALDTSPEFKKHVFSVKNLAQGR